MAVSVVTVYRVVTKHVPWPSQYSISLVSTGVIIATDWWLAESSDGQQLQERAAVSICRAAVLLQSS
jgi:hypothetical protein